MWEIPSNRRGMQMEQKERRRKLASVDMLLLHFPGTMRQAALLASGWKQWIHLTLDCNL
jgi:hypothetical protein